MIPAWNAVRTRVSELSGGRATLVAVSKTKPQETVSELYAAGQRDFGENYVQELHDKAHALAATCPDIRWHFIGHLQSNKAKLLLQTPRLVAVQTVDSAKLASKLDAAVQQLQRDSSAPPLDVYVQVNTSGEASKSGVPPDAASVLALVQHIREQCPRLRFAGLMTIGERGDTTGDFELLRDVRQRVADALSQAPDDFALSMGMSGDYEKALELGSGVVRVGSLIFGARDVPPGNATQ
jgi:pyridoxal phosphate enzyme (YggS family)